MMKKKTGFLVMVVAVCGTSVLAQYSAPFRIDWSQARLTVRDLEEDSRQAYSGAASDSPRELAHSLFTVWGDATALGALVQEGPRAQGKLFAAVGYSQDDMRTAIDAAQRFRLSGNARSFLLHARDTLDRLAEDLGMRGSGHEPPERPPDGSDVLALNLASDGWHGNFFDRYTHLSGTFKGLNLRQADLIVTDSEGQSMWHRDNAFPEIRQYYDTHKFVRPGVVSIPFKLKLPLNQLPRGSAWIYVRLRDMQGNISDQTIPVPADYTRP